MLILDHNGIYYNGELKLSLNIGGFTVTGQERFNFFLDDAQTSGRVYLSSDRKTIHVEYYDGSSTEIPV